VKKNNKEEKGVKVKGDADSSSSDEESDEEV
jgi:hypothetical protein